MLQPEPEAASDAGWIKVSCDASDGLRIVTVIAVLGAAAAVVLGLAGLPSVDLHGPLHKTGIMDPFCGGTRAAHYTMIGQWGLAWKYNPLGIAAVLGAGLAVVRALVGVALGRWLNLALPSSPRRRAVLFGVVVLLVVALEVRQQLRADLLLEGTSRF